MVIFCLALIVCAYTPCPFWDEWVVIDQISKGNGPQSWHWLWAQQNEHRIVLTRLLIWVDLYIFGGRNVSLFVETFLLQTLHLISLCWIVERYTNELAFVKRSIQGLFAFALFHPNQLENFTWSFQVSFVFPFVLGTLALIAVAFFHRWKHLSLVMILVAGAPMVAAMNLAAGLLIGPPVIALAIVRRLPRRFIVGLSGAWIMSTGTYLYGYHRMGSDLPFYVVLTHVKGIFVYVLTYFGASWTEILPHKERTIAFFSLLIYVGILIRRLKRRAQVNDLEWFLLAECLLMVIIAFATAWGRLQFGVGQAFASRYQTPAMIYWAALGALILIRFDKHWPSKFALAQVCLLSIMLASMATFPIIWNRTIRRGDVLRAACKSVMGSRFDLQAAKTLYERPDVVADARTFLLRIWRKPVSPR